MGTTPPNFHTFPEVLSVWPGLAASSRKQLSVPRKGITRRGCTSHKQFCEFALPALEFILPPSQGSTSLLICHWPPASATGRGVLSITEVRLLTLPLESLQLLFPTYFPFFFSFSPQMQIAISFLCKIRERKKKQLFFLLLLLLNSILHFSWVFWVEGCKKGSIKSRFAWRQQSLPWRSNCHAQINGLRSKVQRNSTTALHIFFSKLK